MKTLIPGRIYVERDDRIRYKTLGNKLGRNFFHADIFILAMIYGYRNNVRIPLVRKEALFRTVSARDDFFSIMILLYINVMGEFPKSYDDLSEVVVIAQEYANGGLKFLEEDVYNDIDNFYNKLASNIFKINHNQEFLQLLDDLGR